MPTPTVWSEAPEPHAPTLRDCSYSAVLMDLLYAGFTAFPLGAYTVAEREALERSDDQPNETGASLDDLITAVHRRYGKTLTKTMPGELNALLGKTGIAFVIQGSYGNLPAGHPQRRWDPHFTGPHALTVIPGGPGLNLWLDPEAPMHFAGDHVTDAVVQAFAKGSGQMIVLAKDVFAPPKPKPARKSYVTVKHGNTLGGIAAAHHLTTKQLLAFPENKKYRANPGLIHAGDKVRVK